ncbi:MAG: hypothetical protein ACRD0W_16480 [Acidimicrobiales bacterium]
MQGVEHPSRRAGRRSEVSGSDKRDDEVASTDVPLVRGDDGFASAGQFGAEDIGVNDDRP